MLALVEAFEHQVVLDIFQNHVLCVKDSDTVAGGAFKMILVDIADLLFGGERDIALPAALLEALGAFHNLQLDHHAQWTFEVFWEFVKFESFIKVCHGKLYHHGIGGLHIKLKLNYIKYREIA